MLEALYNLTVIAEYGALSYLSSKMFLDWAWEKTVKILVHTGLTDTPEVQAFLNIPS